MITDIDSIHKYIDEKKKLHRLVLQIIENSNADGDVDYQNLVDFLESLKYQENKQETEHFLHLILVISENHHRKPGFLEKIEKILNYTSKIYKPHFSNEELFTIFQQSKPILLFLLQAKIINIDQIIFQYLINMSEEKDGKIYNYFYPEIKSFIDTNKFIRSFIAIQRINKN